VKEPRDRPIPPADGTSDTDVRHDPVDPHAVQGGLPLPPRREQERPETVMRGEDPLRNRIDPSLETPELRPAVLGRLEGRGLIVVVRAADGALVSADGTWRPADESANLEELRATFPEGSTTMFAGTLIEERDAGTAHEVNLEVVIRRHGAYEYEGGGELHVVNFSPRDFA
jgi:hypothetical protein